VTSAKGTVELAVQPDLTLRPGSCFFPEHFNEPPVKDLIPVEVDALTGVPSFKFARVAIEKL
jgi:formate dehydrogenase alpha subunit